MTGPLPFPGGRIRRGGNARRRLAGERERGLSIPYKQRGSGRIMNARVLEPGERETLWQMVYIEGKFEN